MVAVTNQPSSKIKHQVYRTDGKEVVLVNEAKAEKFTGGGTRVSVWNVSEVSRDKGEYVFGEPFAVAPKDLQWTGRVISAQPV